MWLQGDFHRASRTYSTLNNNNICANNQNNNKSVEADNNNLNTNDNADSKLNNMSSQMSSKFDLKQLTNEVESMGLRNEESGDLRGRRKDKSLTPTNKDPCTYAPGESQGDYLNRLKVSRRYPRSATAALPALPAINPSLTKDDSRYQRSTSQSKGESTYISPFRPLKKPMYLTRSTVQKPVADNIDKSSPTTSHHEATERIIGRRSQKLGETELRVNKR